MGGVEEGTGRRGGVQGWVDAVDLWDMNAHQWT